MNDGRSKPSSRSRDFDTAIELKPFIENIEFHSG
jgi:hypothetical protein